MNRITETMHGLEGQVRQNTLWFLLSLEERRSCKVKQPDEESHVVRNQGTLLIAMG